MKNHYVTIKIKAQFRSNFQKELAYDELLLILGAWKQHLLQNHKNNKIEIKYE